MPVQVRLQYAIYIILFGFLFCDRRITAITSAFQADDVGSTPIGRSSFSEEAVGTVASFNGKTFDF